MISAWLLTWFFRPSGSDSRVASSPTVVKHVEPPVPVAQAAPSRRGREPSSGVEVITGQAGGDMVIRVKGEAGARSAGALLDGLLVSAARRPALVTLDLSELRCISSLAMGVLVAYRRGVVRAGGRVRLAESLQPPVKEALARAEVLDLFEPTAGAGEAPGHQAASAPRAHHHPVAV
jgi:anti-anti-sigma factor